MLGAMGYGYGYQPVYAPSFAYAHAARRSAPASVHVVAILQYLGGAVLLLGAGIVALVTYGVTRQYAGGAAELEAVVGVVGGAGLAVAAVLGLAGLLTIMIGRKLQRGRQWARVLVLLVSATSLAWTLYATFFAAADGAVVAAERPDALSGLVLPLLYLVLLNTPAARSWFRHRTY